MTYSTNDNETLRPVPRTEGPDAHGQAAILLVESLIHTLIAQSIIQIEEAIEAVTVAMDVKMEISADLGDNDDTLDKSLALLLEIARSLRNDVV